MFLYTCTYMRTSFEIGCFPMTVFLRFAVDAAGFAMTFGFFRVVVSPFFFAIFNL